MKTARRSRKTQGQAPPEITTPNSAGHWLATPGISLLLLLVTIAVYLPVCGFDFLSWDDPLNITQNQHLTGPGGPDIGYFWRHPILYVYRPVIYTVWSLAALAAKLPKPVTVLGIGVEPFNPHVFHALNLVIHCMNVLLVFSILRLLIPPSRGFARRAWAAATGALLFSLHPVQVDSVAWITGGNGLLFGTLALLCLRQYIRYAQAARDGGAPGRIRLHYIVASAFFILAQLTYPMAVALPLVALALDIWVIGRPPKEPLRALAVWLILIIPTALITVSVRHVDQIPIHVALWARLFIVGDTFAAYLYNLILPVALGPDYGRTPDYVLGHSWGYLTWLVPAALGVTAWTIRHKQPVFIAAAALFAALLLPVAGLVTNIFQTYSTTADRYLYLPVFALSLLVSWLLANLSKRAGTAVIGVSLAVLAVLGGLTVRHVQDYRDNVAFYTHAYEVNPRSWMAYQNLGKQMVDADKLEDAVALFQKALAVKKPFASAHNDLGIALGKLGRHEEAIAEVQKAIAESPDDATWYTQLGIQYSQLQQHDPSIDAFQHALSLKPADIDAEKDLGTELGLAGRHDEAVAQLAAALQADPNDAQTEDKLAFNLAQKGSIADAVPHWQHAVALKPDFAKAHYNLGVALSTLGKRDEAVTELRAALNIDPNYAPAQAALAKAEGQQGRAMSAH